MRLVFDTVNSSSLRIGKNGLQSDLIVESWSYMDPLKLVHNFFSLRYDEIMEFNQSMFTFHKIDVTEEEKKKSHYVLDNG